MHSAKVSSKHFLGLLQDSGRGETQNRVQPPQGVHVLPSRFTSQPALLKNETKGTKLNINLFKKKLKKQKTKQKNHFNQTIVK